MLFTLLLRIIRPSKLFSMRQILPCWNVTSQVSRQEGLIQLSLSGRWFRGDMTILVNLLDNLNAHYKVVCDRHPVLLLYL